MSVIVQVGITAGFNYITPVGNLTIQNMGEQAKDWPEAILYQCKLIGIDADITSKRYEVKPWFVEHVPGDGVWVLIGLAMMGMPKEE